MENNNKLNKKRLLVALSILIGITGLIIALYFGLGIHKLFKDIELLRERILAFGNKSKLIFVLINFLQTTIIPITNIPTIMAGVYIFGPFESALLSIIGVLFGSVVSFFLGRALGRKAIEWILGKENVDKYLEMAKGRENVVIFLILLLPGFPDDIVCMIAGLTSMSWRFFIITLLITRTIPIFLTAYSASLIPINKLWGIITWALIYIVVFLAGRYVLKYWDQINNYFNQRKTKEKDI